MVLCMTYMLFCVYLDRHCICQNQDDNMILLKFLGVTFIKIEVVLTMVIPPPIKMHFVCLLLIDLLHGSTMRITTIGMDHLPLITS